MSLPTYATRKDLFQLALPRGTIGPQGRLCASVLASTDTLELDEHGFETDDAVTVRATEGGTLAAPLVAGTTYYVIRVNDSMFKLAATAGGAAIGLTTDGVSMVVTAQVAIDRILARYSRMVDGFVPHLSPFSAPYPDEVIAAVCELAAARIQLLGGVTSVSMRDVELAAKAQLERWSKGVPVYDPAATASANLSVTATGTATDSRGWGSGSLP